MFSRGIGDSRGGRRYTCALLVALLALVGGCVLSKPPQFHVEPSGLDVAALSLYPAATKEGNKPVVYRRLELSGSGLLLQVRGRSRRVVDPFWQERDGDDWDDLHEDRTILSKAKTQAYFQKLVDAGVFKPRLMRKQDDTAEEFVLFHAKISRRVNAGATTNPDVLAVFRQLQEEF